MICIELRDKSLIIPEIKDKSLIVVVMLLDASRNPGAWRQQKAGTNSEHRTSNANNKTCHIKNGRVW